MIQTLLIYIGIPILTGVIIGAIVGYIQYHLSSDNEQKQSIQ